MAKGRRVQQTPKKERRTPAAPRAKPARTHASGGKAGLIAAAVVVALLVVGALGVCVWASAYRGVYPKLQMEGLSLGGMSPLEAASALDAAGFGSRVRIDFSLVNDTAYYNGLAFQGFVQGVPRAVLMGGQYDNLLQKLGRDQRAVGFAVYTDGIRSA